jgi:hypothetical protein
MIGLFHCVKVIPGGWVLRFFGMVRDDMRPFFIFKNSIFSFGEIFFAQGGGSTLGGCRHIPVNKPWGRCMATAKCSLPLFCVQKTPSERVRRGSARVTPH